MEIVRDAAEYLWRLVKQPIGSVLAFATFVLALVSAAKGHPILLAPWAWALLAEGGLVVAGFLDWRVARQMAPGHAQWIQSIATSVHDSIAGDRSCLYSDGERNDAHLKELFQSHAPEFTELEREWDRLPGELVAVQNRIREVIRESAVAHWSRPGWHVPTITEGATNWVNQNLPAPPTPPSSPPGSPPFHALNQAVVMGSPNAGTVIYPLPDEPTPAEKEQARQTASDLQNWAREMHGSDEANQWRTLAARKDEVGRLLVDGLQPFMHAPNLSKRRCGESCKAL
jgi:hypothetical protein